MYLNGCSRKLCPMQVGCTDNCKLTKEQCPYFTQDIDYKKVLNLIKAEVAREIFAEIEREINDAMQSNYKVLPLIEQSESLWNRVNGKIDALRGIDGFIEELKKKYTEV